MSLELGEGSYECTVCLAPVARESPIWACGTCFRAFHLGCVRTWRDKSMSGSVPPGSYPVPPRSNDAWRCPGCQAVQKAMPADTCFCGKVRCPAREFSGNPFVPPHTCGEVCGRRRGGGCPHPCEAACHPGPCAPCAALGPPRTCGCGARAFRTRCGQPPSEAQTSCGQSCGRQLGCGVRQHACALPCHEGPCRPCTATTPQSCYCGRVPSAARLCGTGHRAPRSRYLRLGDGGAIGPAVEVAAPVLQHDRGAEGGTAEEEEEEEEERGGEGAGLHGAAPSSFRVQASFPIDGQLFNAPVRAPARPSEGSAREEAEGGSSSSQDVPCCDSSSIAPSMASLLALLAYDAKQAHSHSDESDSASVRSDGWESRGSVSDSIDVPSACASEGHGVGSQGGDGASHDDGHHPVPASLAVPEEALARAASLLHVSMPPRTLAGIAQGAPVPLARLLHASPLPPAARAQLDLVTPELEDGTAPPPPRILAPAPLLPLPSHGYFTCNGVCGAWLDCGLHRCTAGCHSGDCHGCLRLPSRVSSCACGKTPAAFLPPLPSGPRVTCLDPLPTCGQPCGTPLPCGHACDAPCHDGPCPPCATPVPTVCRCGSSDETLPCSDVYLIAATYGGDIVAWRRAAKAKAEGHGGRSKGEAASRSSSSSSSSKDVVPSAQSSLLSSSAASSSFSSSSSDAAPVAEGSRDGEVPAAPSLSDVDAATLPSRLRELRSHPVTLVVTLLRCNRPCGRKLACGRHKCGRPCCPLLQRSDDREAIEAATNGYFAEVVRARLTGATPPPPPSLAQLAAAAAAATTSAAAVSTAAGSSAADLALSSAAAASFRECLSTFPPEGDPAGQGPGHMCMKACGRRLGCGKHTCDLPCHGGHCGPCGVSENRVPLTCTCGGVTMQPPIPCGTLPPSCSRPCPLPRPCGHPHVGWHTCHPASTPCPPCVVPTDKPCAGGHTVRPAMPCHIGVVTCSAPCGRPLPCGEHMCTRPCHAGPCFSASVAASIEGAWGALEGEADAYADRVLREAQGQHGREEEGEEGAAGEDGAAPARRSHLVDAYMTEHALRLRVPCGQRCGHKRKLCGHTCASPCHPLQTCPDTPCAETAVIHCGCGRLCAYVPCLHGSGTADRTSELERDLSARAVPCDDGCASAARARAFGESLGLLPPSSSSSMPSAGDAVDGYPSAAGDAAGGEERFDDVAASIAGSWRAGTGSTEAAGPGVAGVRILPRGAPGGPLLASSSVVGAGKQGHCPYGDSLLVHASNNPAICDKAERALRGLLIRKAGVAPPPQAQTTPPSSSATSSDTHSPSSGSSSSALPPPAPADWIDLPPMPKSHRAFVHQLAALYGVSSLSLGVEPKRHVRLSIRGSPGSAGASNGAQSPAASLLLPAPMVTPLATTSAAAGAGAGGGSTTGIDGGGAWEESGQASPPPGGSSIGTLLAPGVVILPALTLSEAVRLYAKKIARLTGAGPPPSGSGSGSGGAGAAAAGAGGTGGAASASSSSWRPGVSFAASLSSPGPVSYAQLASSSSSSRPAGSSGSGAALQALHPSEPHLRDIPHDRVGCELHLLGLRKSTRERDIWDTVVSSTGITAPSTDPSAVCVIRRLDEHNAVLRFATRGRASLAVTSLRTMLSRGTGTMPPTARVRYWGVGVEQLVQHEAAQRDGGSGYASTAPGEPVVRLPSYRSWGTYNPTPTSGKELPVQRNVFRDAWDM